jgi:4-hydroxybenzoate polyprenyltransferase
VKDVFYLLRLNRTMMVALITGTGAYAAAAGAVRSLWIVLAGWCLAVGGFSLDFCADRVADSVPAWVGIRHNPLANGQVSLRAGLVFSLAFMAASFALTAWLPPPSLVPWAAIAVVIGALALHRFETPLCRALRLGGLQGLYVLMGGQQEP